MEDDDFISKTRRKQRATELQDVGAALVKLSREHLARLDLPEGLLEAVLECKRLTRHEAIRRQMQHIGKIMRNVDAAPIAAQLAAIEAPSRRDTALFHLAEKWRTEMLADPAAVERFVQEFPAASAEQLRKLVDGAKAEREGDRSPKRFRELFHLVNTALRNASGQP